MTKTWNDLWEEYKPRRVKGKKSEAELIRQWEKYLKPVLGPKRVDKTTFQMIEELHRSMVHSPYQANRILALIRPMFRLAGSLQWVPASYNPARDVVAFHERKRRRHLRKDEAPRLAQEMLRGEQTSPNSTLLLWLLVFTGARPGELKRAYWRDLEGNTITLQDHKTADKTGVHERVIVLPPIAMEKLDKLAPPETRHPDQKMFTARFAERVFFNMRRNAGCANLRIYDLRHTFGSYALEQGYNLDQIGEALAHTNPQTTKIYAELTTRNRNKMALDASLAMLKDMEVEDYDISPYIKALT